MKRNAERAAKPKIRAGESYQTGSYDVAISRALDRANKELPEAEQIPRWTPYQLRHAAVTELTETEGLDVARAVAGQRTINMTQHYNHADTKIAVRMAKKRSKK